jgi:MFS family permease
MSGMFEPATRSYFSSVSTEKNRATMLSLGSSASSVGTLLSFLLGGVLMDLGLFKAILICVISFAALYFILLLPIKGTYRTSTQ